MRSLFALITLTIIWSCSKPAETPSAPPNIIIIYADDLGYGDLSCYGATEIKTPNLDRLATEGVKFTNAYATSATCTPSRYALLTGQYPWRNQRARILPGNAPLIIDPKQTTLPGLLQQAGYVTGVTGKWHLGLGGENLDWNGPITPGPNDIGFDYSYIMASTNDRVPTVYVENRHVVGLDGSDPLQVSYQENFEGEPTGKDNPEMLKLHPSHGHDMSVHNGISRIGFMKGGKSALWTDEHMADTILDRSLQFIEKYQDQPFFLYYALHQPHVPRTPHPRFVGKSGMGPRGDVILEIDEAVGELLDFLQAKGLDDKTLIIFSSDNGPVLDDGYQDQAVELIGDHRPAAHLRGGKYSLYEAGTRLPFMVRWPGMIQPGAQSNALFCQIDLVKSLAGLAGIEADLPDSQNMLDVLLGDSQMGRDELILEAIGGKWFKQGDWALIPPREGDNIMRHVNIESGRFPTYQLFNLKEDPSQQKNLAASDTIKLTQMIADFEKALGTSGS